MKNLSVQDFKKMNRPYERFLSFVLISLIFRFVDVIIIFTPENMFLRICIGILLIIIFIIFEENNTKPASRLREICTSLNISTVTLYTVYLIGYFSIFLFLVN